MKSSQNAGCIRRSPYSHCCHVRVVVNSNSADAACESPAASRAARTSAGVGFAAGLDRRRLGWLGILGFKFVFADGEAEQLDGFIVGAFVQDRCSCWPRLTMFGAGRAKRRQRDDAQASPPAVMAKDQPAGQCWFRFRPNRGRGGKRSAATTQSQFLTQRARLCRYVVASSARLASPPPVHGRLLVSRVRKY